MNEHRELAGSPAVSAVCLSDLVLDELVLGRRIAAEDQQHVAGCRRCAARRGLFADAAERARQPVSRLLATASARIEGQRRADQQGRWWHRPYLLGGIAMAAIAILVVAIRRPAGTTDAPPQDVAVDGAGIRVKGAAMRCFVLRKGKVTAVTSGDRFTVGDALRCTITAGEARHVLLVGIDRDARRVAAYYPFGGTDSIAMPIGVEIALPDSLVLDDAPGPEYLVAVFSTTPFNLELLQHRLDQHDQLAKTRGDRGDPQEAIARLAPDGRRIVFVVRKP